MPQQPKRRSSPGLLPADKGSDVATPHSASNSLVLHVARLSDVGRTRDHQEDAAEAITPSDPAVLARRGQLLIVADGMGGHNAGEIASIAALAEIRRVYYSPSASDEIAANLRQAVTSANQVVYQIAQGDVARAGMGTTVALAVVRDREVHVANVGDSRVYLIRNGQITQITQDHSYVEEQVRLGVLTPEQARVHPQRNIITRALGSGPAVEPDLFNGVLLERDVLLLCSDGLSGHVTDAEMMQIAGGYSPDLAVRKLVDLANERGGSDNISTIVARLEAQSPTPSVSSRKTGRRLPVALWAGILVAILLVVIGGVAYVFTRPNELPKEQALVGPSPTPIALIGTVAPLESAPTAVTDFSGAVASASVGAPTATIRPTDTPSPTSLPSPTVLNTPTLSTTRLTSVPTHGNLPAPEVLSPIDGDSPLGLVLFKWGSVPGAWSYRVETRSDHSGQTEWKAWLTPQTEFQVVYDQHPDYFLVPGTIYFWRVTAVDARGNLGAYSSERRFVFQREGELPPTPTTKPTPIPEPSPTSKPTPTKAVPTKPPAKK